jgi:hypothetical protein
MTVLCLAKKSSKNPSINNKDHPDAAALKGLKKTNQINTNSFDSVFIVDPRDDEESRVEGFPHTGSNTKSIIDLLTLY